MFTKLKNKKSTLIFLVVVNWLLEVLSKWQFYIFTSFISGIVVKIATQDRAIVNFFISVLILVNVFSKIERGNSSSFRVAFNWAMRDTVLYFIFIFGYSLSRPVLTNQLVLAWIISCIIYLIIRYGLSRLYEYYILKKVLNKPYLGIKKPIEPIIKDNFFKDMKIESAFERMNLVNQKAIQIEYQNIVELSAISSIEEIIPEYFTDVATHETHREFVNNSVVYYLIFKIYPFGFGKANFSLLRLRLDANSFLAQESYLSDKLLDKRITTK